MNVLIRCDSSFEIGSGHLFRCLSIAKQLQKSGHNVDFACLPLQGSLTTELKNHSFTIQIGPKDTLPVNWIPSEKMYDVCIIDQYSLGDEYESKLRKFSKKIIAIDDWGNRKHNADIIIDPSISSNSKIRQSINPTTQFLSGSDWLLMREEFIDAHKIATPRNSIKNVLIFFGGTDPKDLIIKYLETISSIKSDLNFHFLISTGHPRLNEFKCVQKPPHVFFDFSPQNMATYLSNMDFYLGSAGTITWERKCVGLTGLVISIAENQIDQAETLDRLGLHHYLGKDEFIKPDFAINELFKQLDSPNSIYEISKRSLKMIDGQGCNRLVNLIEKLI